MANLLLRREMRAPKSGGSTVVDFDEMSVERIRADAHAERSVARAVNGGRTGYYKFLIQEAGTVRLTQFGRTVVLASGDVTVYDTAFPYSLVSEGEVDLVVYAIPHGTITIPQYMVDDYTVATTLSGDDIAQPIAMFLIGLADHIAELGPDLRSRFTPVVGELVETLLRPAHRRPARHPDHEDRRVRVDRRVHRGAPARPRPVPSADREGALHLHAPPAGDLQDARRDRDRVDPAPPPGALPAGAAGPS
jgi:hypothetical protein